MHPPKTKGTIEAVLRRLVARDFDALLQLAPRSRVTAEEVSEAVTEYGRRPVMPAVPVEELWDVVEVRDSHPRTWSINLPLWTEEEGRSDLTLEMRFTESETELYSVEIDDLHVL